MKITKKTKTYVGRAALALLVVFAMNRCTVACNRGRSIDKFESTAGATIDSLKNRTDSLQQTISLLCKDTAYLRQNIADLNSKNSVLVEKSTKQQIVHNHYSEKNK